MPSLTPRQRAVVAAVNALTWARGYPPSLKEIARASGLASTQTVLWHLNGLAQIGIVRREPYRPRTVRLSPRIAGSKGGLLAEIVPVARCAPCGMDVPADHACPPDAGSTDPCFHTLHTPNGGEHHATQ